MDERGDARTNEMCMYSNKVRQRKEMKKLQPKLFLLPVSVCVCVFVWSLFIYFTIDLLPLFSCLPLCCVLCFTFSNCHTINESVTVASLSQQTIANISQFPFPPAFNYSLLNAPNWNTINRCSFFVSFICGFLLHSFSLAKEKQLKIENSL